MNFCIMFGVRPNSKTAKRLDLPEADGNSIAEIEGSIHDIPAAAMLKLVEELLKNSDIIGFTITPATHHKNGNARPHNMRTH